MQIVSRNGLTFRLLYSSHHIKETITKMAHQINAYYTQLKQKQQSLDLVVVCVLKGAFMFFSDIVKDITHPHVCEFIKCHSYEGFQSTGNVVFTLQPNAEDFAGKNVLLVDDIHDTGRTLQRLMEKLWKLKPKSIDCAVLVVRPDKPIKIDLKFRGLECSGFIIGYGLDFNEQLRHLSSIYEKV